jgi:phage terminase Nu1 subunit (DNA packaging protein)
VGNPANYEALDATTIAELLGVSTRQLRNYYTDKGLPTHGDGRERTFVWREVLDWYVGYRKSTDRYAGNDGSGDAESGSGTSGSSRKGEKLGEAQARKESAQADLKEMELKKRRGELVAMDDVSRKFNDVCKGMQTGIRGLPTRIVGRVLSIRDRDELVAYLTEETDLTLTRLSQLRVDDEPEAIAPDDLSGDGADEDE